MTKNKKIKIGMIGLDTSHAIEYTKRLQSPDCPAELKVNGARVISCMRFATPFQTEEGLDKRQKLMEAWGVKVTRDFDEAINGADALMLEINDPSLHLEYFERCADLGKPVFLDKPLADSFENGKKICDLAQKKNIPFLSAASTRYSQPLLKALEQVPAPFYCTIFGPLVQAKAGSSIIWYGVNPGEMLIQAMGRGARSVLTAKDSCGAIITIEYANRRRAVLELTDGVHKYGGFIRTNDVAVPFYEDNAVNTYSFALKEIVRFLSGGASPVPVGETLEMMAILDAAEQSYQKCNRIELKI